MKYNLSLCSGSSTRKPKKFFTGLYFILVLAFPLTAQTDPVFQTTLWVEDARGNMDSVRIGYDPGATDWVDHEFGEVLLTSPFDSVLDVRVGLVSGQSEGFSKVNIAFAEPVQGDENGCLAPLMHRIYVHALYQPVTLRWDRSLFSGEVCLKGSFVSNHWADAFFQDYDWDNWFPDNIYSCMAIGDTLRQDLSPQAMAASDIQHPIVTQAEILGQSGFQEVFGWRISLLPPEAYPSPCLGLVEVEDLKPGKAKDIRLYPNPASEFLVIDTGSGSPGPWTFRLFDLTGKQVAEAIGSDLPGKKAIRLPPLPAGWYAYRLWVAGQHLKRGSLIIE